MAQYPDEQPPLSPFKTDAEMWEAAFQLYDELAEEHPELQKKFKLQWLVRYEFKYGRPPGWEN